MPLYNIVRFYHRPFTPNGPYRRVLRRNVTLAEALAHCKNLETASYTATSVASRRITRRVGCRWFDSYEEAR